MATKKPDTSRGFRPAVPAGPETLHPAVHAIRLDGRLDRTALSPQLHQTLLGMARVRNAVSSFRLEGERVDLDRARAIFASQRPESPAERGVLQLGRAYREVSENHLPEFTVAGIERAHRKLFEGVLGEEMVGRLKDRANLITDPSGTIVRFLPTPPERTRAELEALVGWVERAGGSLLPPVAAALFFAEFQAIHPFLDGNGRLGRYLNVALLRRFGLKNAALAPLDTRFFRTSDHYYEALASTNSGTSYHLWVRYFTRELRKAYEVAVRRGDLQSTLQRFTRRSTRSVLDWVLMGSGEWFQRSDYPNLPGYSGPAVWGALQELVKTGILEEHGAAKGRRYRLRSAFLADIYGRRA